MKIALTVALSAFIAVAPLHAAEPELDVKPLVAIKDVVVESTITLRHVKPSMMALWLDPRFAGKEETGSTSGTVALPEGVKSITPDDKANILSVRATEEGFERLRELIALLDRRIPQIEISAKLISVSTAALESLTQTKKDNLGGGFVTRGNFSAQVDEMIKNGTARVTAQPRISTFNNQRAEVASLQGIFYSQSVDEKGKFLGYLATSYGNRFVFIPTLQQDGSINVTSQIELGYVPVLGSNHKPQTFGQLPEGAKLSTNEQHLQVISTSAIIKDGDTLLIGGLRATNEKNEKSGEELLIALAARQIHHIDDSIVLDATTSSPATLK